MRKLLVPRGLPGSGKSTLIREIGLEGFVLGADQLRMVYSGLEMMPDGQMSINQANAVNAGVWGDFRDIAEERMSRGETLVLDATFAHMRDFKPFGELAKKYFYQTVFLDFTDISIEQAFAQNMGRPEWKQVPFSSMERMQKDIQNSGWAEGIRRISVKKTGEHIGEIEEFLKVPVLDLNQYSQIVHVGDLQGCCTPLTELVDRLGGLKDDSFWIFVGDALDRGIENGEVFRWLLDNAVDKPNVRFLWGNHEEHIAREAVGREHVSDEFVLNTLPQLKAAGISSHDMKRFIENVSEVILYRYKGEQVMVNHAGLATVPKQPWMISTRQWSNGTGYYEQHVDADFERLAPQGWTQVHGHRNSYHLPVRASARSFNLEESVEFGGNLRAVVLDEQGWHEHKIANRIFKPFRERKPMKNTIIPHWMGESWKEMGNKIAPDLKTKMDEHPGVYEQISKRSPHVASLNFSKDVFFDAAWDAVVVKARGLFINTQTSEVVARGYDKFFNEGELTATQPEALKANLKFPLTGYLKENGFFGTLGYDRETDSLFISSKSNPDSPFADMFTRILEQTMPSIEHREELKRWLRDTESCMPFEVIDPVGDPHIIEYEGSKLVLLDVLHRSTEFSRMPYKDLQKVAKYFGFECKQRSFSFKDWEQYEGWYSRAKEDMRVEVEGWVFEDSEQFQFKIKTPFYSHWKGMRSMKDYIVRSRDKAARELEREIKQAKGKPDKIEKAEAAADMKAKNEEISTRQRLDHQLKVRGHEFLHDLAHGFRDWCLEQSSDTLKKDIVELRKDYYKAMENKPDITPPTMR